jgi:hypothetical protein
LLDYGDDGPLFGELQEFIVGGWGEVSHLLIGNSLGATLCYCCLAACDARCSSSR